MDSHSLVLTAGKNDDDGDDDDDRMEEECEKCGLMVTDIISSVLTSDITSISNVMQPYDWIVTYCKMNIDYTESQVLSLCLWAYLQFEGKLFDMQNLWWSHYSLCTNCCLETKQRNVVNFLHSSAPLIYIQSISLIANGDFFSAWLSVFHCLLWQEELNGQEMSLLTWSGLKHVCLVISLVGSTLQSQRLPNVGDLRRYSNLQLFCCLPSHLSHLIHPAVIDTSQGAESVNPATF